MISLLVTLLVLFETHFFPAWWNISNTPFRGICLYWAFLRNPHYLKKQSSKAVQEEITLPDKGSLHSSSRKVVPNSKHQVLFLIHSRYGTPWFSPTFWIMHHFCGLTWSEAVVQLPENLAQHTVKCPSLHPLFHKHIYQKKDSTTCLS